jgi:hypothetical protein
VNHRAIASRVARIHLPAMALAHHHGEKSGNLYRLPARELFDFYLAILRHELADLYQNFKGCVTSRLASPRTA